MSLQVEVRDCRCCGNEFAPLEQQHAFCSDECKTKGTERQCRYCEENFWSKSNHDMFCSPECKREERHEREHPELFDFVLELLDLVEKGTQPTAVVPDKKTGKLMRTMFRQVCRDDVENMYKLEPQWMETKYYDPQDTSNLPKTTDDGRHIEYIKFNPN